MKKIISKTILLCSLFVTILLSSCDFLDVDRYFDDTFQQDSIFANRVYAEGYLWHTPTLFPDPGAVWGTSWTPGNFASDELTTRWRTTQFHGLRFSIGLVDERTLGTFNIWGNMYRIIRRCNIMLANINYVPGMTTAERNEYIANVRFIRAWAYYHLLMNWGPLLIVYDEVLPNDQPAEFFNRPRATFDYSIEYIISELEAAIPHLPMPGSLSMAFMQRPTRGAAMALIARLRLLHASPLWNGGDAARQSFGGWRRYDGQYYVAQTPDPRRWALAAAAARAVIDIGFYELHTVPLDAFNPYFPLAPNVPDEPFPYGAGGIDPILSFHNMFNGETPMQVNREFIWAHPSGFANTYTRHVFPAAFHGWAGLAVPRRVVDTFLMNDGRTFAEAAAEDPELNDLTYTIGSPRMLGMFELRGNVPRAFDNRDARFYATIGFPGRVWTMRSAMGNPDFANQQVWFAEGTPTGPSASGANINDINVTGFTSVKWVHPDDSWANVTGAFRNTPKPFPVFRYAEILLIYIEALNNVEGSVTVPFVDVLGQRQQMTVTRDVSEMQRYFNKLRWRAGVPGPSAEQLADRATTLQLVMNERQVELFNENHRFFDTRRWGIFVEEDARPDNWQGLDVFRTRDEGFWNYVHLSVSQQNIRDRQARARMVLLPLPHTELLRVPAMSQNPGWSR